MKLVSKKGFTLVETLISMTLLAVLFSVLGGLLFGMSHIANLTNNITSRSREVNFCFELIRKELGESVINNMDPRFSFLAGENFISYATIRQELVARDDVARGYKRIEWRYFPDKKVIRRSITPINEIGQEIGSLASNDFLPNTESVDLSYFIDGNWQKIDSKSEILPRIKAIRMTIRFKPDEKNKKESEKIYSTAFSCLEQISPPCTTL